MNKSHALKHSREYQSGQLRERISASIKMTHNEATDEETTLKKMGLLFIPVTGVRMAKYSDNKTGRVGKIG